MSIRRESCDPCFAGRRKCDLTYPVCGRCQRSNKRCHYVYPPRLPIGDTANVASATGLQPSTEANFSCSVTHVEQAGQEPSGLEARSHLDHGQLMVRLGELRRHMIPETLCMLGQLPLLSGPADLGWVFDQIRDCPLSFANKAETIFIHRELFSSAMPLPLRTAFGICAGVTYMNDRSRPVLFKVISAEISDLLVPNPTSTLLEDLARLQAAVLYQIIRFYHGDLEQRIIAEQQEYLVRSFGLKLFHRADIELPQRQTQPSWEDWILAESIRRSVIVSFKLYTLYWTFRDGACRETTAISMLPVSINPSSWTSREVYIQYSDRDQTTTYAEFSALWTAAPREVPHGFERLLLTSCRGVENFSSFLGIPSVEG